MPEGSKISGILDALADARCQEIEGFASRFRRAVVDSRPAKRLSNTHDIRFKLHEDRLPRVGLQEEGRLRPIHENDSHSALPDILWMFRSPAVPP